MTPQEIEAARTLAAMLVSTGPWGIVVIAILVMRRIDRFLANQEAHWLREEGTLLRIAASSEATAGKPVFPPTPFVAVRDAPTGPMTV